MRELETNEDLPPVSLHNNAASGNIFRTDNCALKFFDFGLSSIGHPFMDMSFRLISEAGSNALIRWRCKIGHDPDNSASQFKQLFPHSLIVHLFTLLKRIERAQQSKIFRMADILMDACSLLNMILPKEVSREKVPVAS